MSLVIALSATPGLLGTQEAVRQAQRKESREEHRARRCNFIAHCIKSSLRAREINDRPLVLRDGRIFIDSAAQDDDQSTTNCAGYYLPYPDSPYEGLVTRISTILPIMNWVYIDVATHQLRYGVRKDAEGNMTGPFDCTSHSRRVTFQGWEGFCAVEEQPGEWAVYFDVDDDALKGKVPHGTRILEIEIERREERWKKGEHAVVPVRRNVVQTQRSENDGVQGAPSQPQTEAPITAPQEPTVPLSPTRQQVPVSKTIPQPKIYSPTAPRQAIPAPTKPPSTTQSITAPSTIQPPWPSSISTLEREYRSKSTSPSKISNSSTEPPLSPTATPKTLRHSPRSISGRHMNPPSKPTTQNKPKQIPSQQRPLSPMTHSPNSPIRTLASREMLSLFNDDERQYIEEFSTLFTNTLRPLSVSLSLSFPDSASPRRHSSSSIIRRAVRRMSTGGSSLFKSLSIGKGLGERRRTGNGAERVSRVLRRKRKTF